MGGTQHLSVAVYSPLPKEWKDKRLYLFHQVERKLRTRGEEPTNRYLRRTLEVLQLLNLIRLGEKIIVILLSAKTFYM
ncbi:hypothetical protein PVAP13_9NG320900 [Panicum virgatum]|uniref:Uncharacterized protein n=1 Tax=Panicum virgatum TaxID=38727 RepID=A0A8T0MSC9_PANVG|nr:hypothetical protein PVAP13_9NG320900 [Panicum virgatum]